MKYKIAFALTILIAASPLLFAQTQDNLLIQNPLSPNESLSETISTAIQKFEQTPSAKWAFQVSRYENEEGDITSSTEQYQPHDNIEKQWTLITIDGKPPTSKQSQKFIKQKVKKAQKEGEQKSLSIKLSKLIKLESLQLIDESTGNIQAQFDVQLDRLGKSAQKKLLGTLFYNKDKKFVERIEITNKDEFSPMFSATITVFELSMEFIQIDNSVLIQQQNLNMKGSFAFFTQIDEVSSDVFSNYCYVPEAQCY